MIKLTDEEKETLSYDDVAYLILQDLNKKIKIQDLFKKVISAMGLDDSVFENNIAEFFELIVTDKRFIMLDAGYCDLKINHSSKMIIDDDDDDFLIEEDDDEEPVLDEDNYDAESNPDDTEDDLQDLVVIDEDSDDLESDMM